MTFSFKNLFQKNGIGVDLGSSTTLFYLQGQGVKINELSLIALDRKNNSILAVGHEAKGMIGRTPQYIDLIKPVKNGIISDFEATELMLKKFFSWLGSNFSLKGNLAIVTVPSGLTEVQQKAALDVVKNVGISDVRLLPGPMASALGAGVNIDEAKGVLIVDFGGGKTDIAVISLGGVVYSKNSKIGGEALNQNIIDYLKEEMDFLIGESTAEEIKTKVGQAKKSGEVTTLRIKGRDLSSGLPKEMMVSSNHIYEAINASLLRLSDEIINVLDNTPPELLADVLDNGVLIAGGGSNLKFLDELVADITGLPVVKVDDPHTATIKGAGLIVENLNTLGKYLLNF